MPIHDWSRVEAGIFHAFHHAWIEELSRRLNAGILPADYYALAEQHAAGFGPDVLTLQAADRDSSEGRQEQPPVQLSGRTVAVLTAPPKTRLTAETDMEFYRRKQNAIVVRHVSGDRMVAVLEVVSPGNKSTRHALRAFVDKAAALLDQRIHLLVLDLHPPAKLDPQGIHGAIWEEISGQEYVAPAGQPLTLAAYESELTVRAHVEPLAVGDVLADMPLFLEPGGCVIVPTEATYENAFAVFPQRWRRVLEPASQA
jgi:hypothetical protein